MRAISFPHEHGGGVVAVGATLSAALVAPEPSRAVAVGICVAASFLARGPVDRLAARKPLARFDGTLLAALAILAGAALVLLGWAAAGVTLGACTVIIGASAIARRTRKHRDVRVEIAGLAFLGATAGLAALLGGASTARAAQLALVIGVHGALAVPLVRAELRPRELQHLGARLLPAAVVLGGLALVLVLAGAPRVVLALAPRAVHLIASRLRPHRMRPSIAALRETLFLAFVVVMLALA
jgi:hypothetical protein